MKYSPKEALQKIKALMLGFTAEPAAGDTAPSDVLKEYITSSGSKLKIDKLETGGKAFGEDGTTPAAAGDYTMVDGTMVTIDANGMITVVTAPAPATDPATDTSAAAFTAMMAKFAAGTPEERISNLETMCKALMQYSFQWKITEATRESIEQQAIAAFNTLTMPATFKAQFDSMELKLTASETARKADRTNFAKTISDLCDAVMQFAAAPSDDAAHGPKDKTQVVGTRADRAAAILAAAGEAKKNNDK